MEIETRRYFDVKCDLFLDERHTDRKGNKKVMIRVYHERKYKKINTGLKLSSWSSVTDEERKKVMQIYENVWHRVIDLVGRDCFSIDNVTDAKVSTTLNDFMSEKIEELRSNKQLSTAAHYNGALKLLNERFGELPVKNMTADHFKELRKHMESKGYSPTTMQIYLTDIKAVVNWLRYKKIIREEDYPFRTCVYDTDKVAIPKGRKRTDCWLDKLSIRKLWNRWKESHDRWLGMWLFSYLAGGMNIADVLDLRFDSHWARTKGEELKYRRKKTAKKNDFDIIVPVTTELKEIIDSVGIRDGQRIYSDLDGIHDAEDTRHVIMRVNTKIGKSVKNACSVIGITENVTPTWARHSFATVMSRERVPANFIEAIMGHANNGVSSHYIAGYSSEDMREFLSMLL